MDRIEQIISTDNSRSHRNGLLPFVRYGGDGSIETVTAIDSNGNYGQYVCDFCIFDRETKQEKHRLKYLDVMNNYNFVQECLRNAVYVKKFSITKDVVTKIDCGADEESNATITKVTNTHTAWRTDFEESASMGKYDYAPLDAAYFRKDKYGYVFEVPYQYENAKAKDESERTDDDSKLIEKIEDISAKTINNDFCVLLSNYDTVMSMNDWWGDWWKNFKEEEWERDAFNNYTTIDTYFKFCTDIDRYVLGEVEVVGSGITGSRVPSYVYYTNCFDLMDWFETQSASTVNAYEEPNSENKWVRHIWEERGGGEFYNFLSNINVSWQTQKVAYADDVYFTFVPPTIDLEVIINAEEEYETLYSVYEYNVTKTGLEGAVKPYAAVEDSNLKPQWLDCRYSSAYCETKLESLIHPKTIMITDNIFGVFKNFDESNPEKGQMFNCKYCSGHSKTPEVIVYHSAIVTTYTEVTEGDVVNTKVDKEYIGESIFGTIDEKCPDTNAYQVFNTAIVNFSAGTQSAYTLTKGTKEKPEREDFYLSAITWNEYVWWDCNKESKTTLVCADGEIVPPNTDKYRNVTIVSCLPSLVGNCNVNDVFYVMARYDNGNVNPGNVRGIGTIHSMGIPYVKNVRLNITSYDDETITYDEVLNINTDSINNSLTIAYAKGITSGTTVNREQSGIHYEETMHYESNAFAIVPIDGVYMAELYYDLIGDGYNQEYVYSDEYRQYRIARKAKVTGMEVGTQWTNDNAVEALLITKEGCEGLQEEPKYSINLLYNRGNAAAWENHFKLSECNTMEDLENYGNNFFNL